MKFNFTFYLLTCCSIFGNFIYASHSMGTASYYANGKSKSAACPETIKIGALFTVRYSVVLQAGEQRGVAFVYDNGEPGAAQKCVTAAFDGAYLIEASTTQYEVNKILYVVDFAVEEGQTCESGVDVSDSWNILCTTEVVQRSKNDKQICPDLKTWCVNCEYCPNGSLCPSCDPSATAIPYRLV